MSLFMPRVIEITPQAVLQGALRGEELVVGSISPGPQTGTREAEVKGRVAQPPPLNLFREAAQARGVRSEQLKVKPGAAQATPALLPPPSPVPQPSPPTTLP